MLSCGMRENGQFSNHVPEKFQNSRLIPQLQHIVLSKINLIFEPLGLNFNSKPNQNPGSCTIKHAVYRLIQLLKVLQ